MLIKDECDCDSVCARFSRDICSGSEDVDMKYKLTDVKLNIVYVDFHFQWLYYYFAVYTEFSNSLLPC